MNVAPSPTSPVRLEERHVPPALQGLVSRVLRVGVLISSALLIAGLAVEGTTGHGSLLMAAAPSTGGTVSAFLQRGGAPALLLLGVLVLAATPLSRVAISTALFGAARDRTFALITLFVLAVLVATVIVGVLR